MADYTEEDIAQAAQQMPAGVTFDPGLATTAEGGVLAPGEGERVAAAIEPTPPKPPMPPPASPGQAVPSAGPTAPAPRPVPAPAPRPQAPPDLQGQAGGRYYAPNFAQRITERRNAIETARLQGKLSDTEASSATRQLDVAEAAFAKHQQSLPGVAARLARQQGEAQAIQGQAAANQYAVKSAEEAAAANVAGQAADEMHRARIAAAKRLEYHQLAQDELRRKVAAADEDIAKFKIGDKRPGALRAWDAIASALSAFGSALTGTPDQASKIIQQQIQRSIDAQKEQLASKRQHAGKLRNDLDAYEQQFGSGEDAQRALMARYLRQNGMRVRQIASRAKSETARVKMNEMADLMDNQARMNETGVLGNALQQKAAEDQLRAQYAAQQAAAQKKAERKKALEAAGHRVAKINQQRANQYVKGLGFVDVDQSEIKNITRVISASNTINSLGASVIQHLDGLSSFDPRGPIPSNIAPTLKTIGYQYSLANQQGAVTGGEMRNFSDSLAMGRLNTVGEARAALRALMGSVNVAKEQTIAQHNIMPGHVERLPDEEGNDAVYAVYDIGAQKK